MRGLHELKRRSTLTTTRWAIPAPVQAYHDGSSRWWYRGLVIFDISSLAGNALVPNGTSFNFHSFGFSGVTPQYGGGMQPAATTADDQAGGSCARVGWPPRPRSRAGP
jgi:hypothetical protein